jgi:H+/Cl- antiporter ClcA
VKSVVILGAILLVLGVIGLAMPVFTTTQNKDVAKLGDLKLQAKETDTYVIPPVAAAGIAAVGAVVVGIGALGKR